MGTRGVRAQRSKSILLKPVTVNYSAAFKALTGVVGHVATAKWAELGSDAADAIAALGITTNAEELAGTLVKRTVTRALFDLVGESANQYLADVKQNAAEVAVLLDTALFSSDLVIDKKFFDRPADLPVVSQVASALQQWLAVQGVPHFVASAISERFLSYFVYAAADEWRQNAKQYQPLLDAVHTPFAKATDREWAWEAYSALLQRRVDEGIFDEPFSLRQIYVPLNAYYLEEVTSREYGASKNRRVVVSLETELSDWLNSMDRYDTIRVISGGPGSGKSSFARIFAAQIAGCGNVRVLFVPLHLIDPSKSVTEEVRAFARDEGLLAENPLDPASAEANLLVIFDGLDELANQGQAAAETARAFIRDVERTVEKRNTQGARVRVLISGRELVIQETESEFRRPRQVLNLLPYFVADPYIEDEVRIHNLQREQYADPDSLLKLDKRELWWQKYGVLTGRPISGLPSQLRRHDLEDITAQPLLNYLVALSFTRDRIDFGKDVNLNLVYEDLVAAVHERAYEKGRAYGPIRHMPFIDFIRVLEEIGLAAWHGDGRSTTVREIEEHCRISGVGKLLDAFTEGARAGVTRLLAAFFFRQYGQRAAGDPTFVFTHKSFGEYLAARRVVRAVERVTRERTRRLDNADEGWDERDALKHWVQICGPAPVSRYLRTLVLNELHLRRREDMRPNQQTLTNLLSFILQSALPIEMLQLPNFRIALFQARNAEEALLVALDGSARLTREISMIKHPDPVSFGTWLHRVRGQRAGAESAIVLSALSHLNLRGALLHNSDFYEADLSHSDLSDCGFVFTVFTRANMQHAILDGANFRKANLEDANLEGASVKGAQFDETNIRRARLRDVDLSSASVVPGLKGDDRPSGRAKRVDAKRKGSKEDKVKGR